MTAGGWLARIEAMGEAAWARRASPRSVWTRLATLALLLLAIWSHAWIGWTAAASALLAVAVWTFASPRLFAPPKRTDRWASRAVFGERVWLARRVVPIPPHHERAAAMLSLAAGAGGLVGIVGAILSDLTATLAGGLVAYMGKLWFLDRMVWLYQDMRDMNPIYESWEHGSWEHGSREHR